jgi:sodium/hydrogen antiporter
MSWSLAIVALTLLAVAACSRRLSGTPVTPAMVFVVVVGVLVVPLVLDELNVGPTSSEVRGCPPEFARD